MKKVRKSAPFDWSRRPSREGIHMVFLADPNALTKFGNGITKDELCNSLSTYNKFTELERNKQQLHTMLATTLASIPFIFLIYNIFFGVSK